MLLAIYGQANQDIVYLDLTSSMIRIKPDYIIVATPAYSELLRIKFTCSDDLIKHEISKFRSAYENGAVSHTILSAYIEKNVKEGDKS